MRSYKAEGIVLNSVKYGDNALVVQMITNTEGRQSYMIQGVKSQAGHGSKAAMLQPMFLVEFEGIVPTRGSLHRVRDMRLSVPLPNLAFDVRKSTIALFMAEVLYRLVRQVETDSPLFDYVRDAVVALDSADSGVANFHLRFLVGLSSFLGFYPANEYVTGNWFDIREGRFVAFEPSHRMVLSQPDSELLDLLMNTPFEQLDRVQLSHERRSQFLASMLNYYSYHLDLIYSVKSISILGEVF